MHGNIISLTIYIVVLYFPFIIAYLRKLTVRAASADKCIKPVIIGRPLFFFMYIQRRMKLLLTFHMFIRTHTTLLAHISKKRCFFIISETFQSTRHCPVCISRMFFRQKECAIYKITVHRAYSRCQSNVLLQARN